jgi:hypothetical protein
MARVGRKPLGAAHVDHLTGSPLAKERLRWILQTMRGERTVQEACRALSIGPSRFHAMRNRWLQRAVGLLEPRRAGRPPKAKTETVSQTHAQQLAVLAEENQQLQQRVIAAQVREQLAHVMPHVVRDRTGKKKRRARRRKAR